MESNLWFWRAVALGCLAAIMFVPTPSGATNFEFRAALFITQVIAVGVQGILVAIAKAKP